MNLPSRVPPPSLLLSCGAKSEHFVLFSEGYLFELAGRFLRLSDSQGTTEYIPLHASPDVGAEAAHYESNPGYGTFSAFDKTGLVALGASGAKAAVQLLQLEDTQPKCHWTKTLCMTRPTEIVALEFSSCGLYLFCLSCGFQPQPQQPRGDKVHYVTVFSVSQGTVQACHQLQWNDSGSLPSRLLAASGGIAAVFSKTNMTLLQLRQNGEESLATSGHLLPLAKTATAVCSVEEEKRVTICGACWVTMPAEDDQTSSVCHLLFVSLNNKVLLVIGVGWLGVEGPSLPWIVNTEHKYLSLAVEEDTGILLGFTEEAALDSFKIKDAALASNFQRPDPTGQQHDIEASVSAHVVTKQIKAF